MTYSIDKCVKLLGYEYELPDEIILIIQRMVIDEKFKKSIRACMCKIHMGVRIRHISGGITPFHKYREKPDFYEDGTYRNRYGNPVRRCLWKPSWVKFNNNLHNENPNRYIPRIDNPYYIDVLGMSLSSGFSFNYDCGMELDNILKRDMVEHMKINGMKFNKSKTKPQLFHIFMKHKNFIEEPFIYTYKNIKKIKYD